MLLEDTSLSQGTLDLTFHIEGPAETADGKIGVIARATENSQYSVRAEFQPDGTVQLIALSGDEVIATQQLDGVTSRTDTLYTLRVSVTGSSPTTISAKMWEVGTDEPENWQLTTTDATPALQEAGAVGLVAEQSGDADSLTARFEKFGVVSAD
ncbi:hypothetical protein [Brachybacterium paraconglomeratum]|uniref:hypothetical protein n=1 Tax=Brachybacterium paraconglomeratum TaxID=173362 RepID=UPI0031F15600